MEDLRDKFQRLAKKWKQETSHLSSTSRVSMHMSYQSIIGMGMPVVPIILEELKREPDHWFWALMAITEENPVLEEDRGYLDKMAEAWIEWGKKRCSSS